MPYSCTVAGLTFDSFKALSGSYLEILVSSLQMPPFNFVKNVDFSHKIHLLVSPTTNNGPDLNLEIQGAAVCRLLMGCCVEEFATWSWSCAA